MHPLLLIFARVTHHELARMVQYLKVENAILRGKLLKVVQVTPRERAPLVKYGKAVGDKIKELIQIVTPRTFARLGLPSRDARAPPSTSASWC